MANGMKCEVKSLLVIKKLLNDVLYDFTSHSHKSGFVVWAYEEFLPLSFLTTRNEFVKSWGEMLTEEKKVYQITLADIQLFMSLISVTCIMHDHKKILHNLHVYVYTKLVKIVLFSGLSFGFFKCMCMRVEKRPFHDYPTIKGF